MTAHTINDSIKSSWKQIVVAALAIAYVAINGLTIGGDAFVIALNNNIAIPLAIAVTLLTIWLWNRLAIGSQNRVLWTGLAIGWVLWTIAEFWWGIASIIGQKVPYPSWADFFWLAGYVPMFIALWTRIRSLPRSITPLQQAGIWVSVLLSLGWTIWFVLLPIVRYNDPSVVLESVLNLLYPLVDLFLLILILRIFFTYQQGIIGRAWGWLSLGFVLHSISNLVFSYASTAELFYPDDRVNLLSSLGIDAPYNLAYLFWLIGLWIVRGIHGTHQVIQPANVALTPVSNTHLLVFTKGDDTVIDVSGNFAHVFNVNAVVGMSVSDVLGISPLEADRLLKESRAGSILAERAMTVNTRFGPREARVSGISITNPQQEYSGATFLLRMIVENRSLDESLSNEQKQMVQVLLRKTGVKEKEEQEIMQLLVGYYLAHLRGFHQHVFENGGATMADAFFVELQSVVQKHGWQMDIHPGETMLDAGAFSLSTAREALPIIFESARRFVTRISGTDMADSIVQAVRSRIDPAIQMNVAYFEKISR